MKYERAVHLKKTYELTEWYFIFASTKHYNCALKGEKRATPDRSRTLNLSSPNASSLNLLAKILMGWEALTDFSAHTAWVQVGLQKNSRLRANFTRVRWVAKRKVRKRLGEGYLAIFAGGNIEFLEGHCTFLGTSLVLSFLAGSNWYGLDPWISKTSGEMIRLWNRLVNMSENGWIRRFFLHLNHTKSLWVSEIHAVESRFPVLKWMDILLKPKL